MQTPDTVSVLLYPLLSWILYHFKLVTVYLSYLTIIYNKLVLAPNNPASIFDKIKASNQHINRHQNLCPSISRLRSVRVNTLATDGTISHKA